MSLAARLAEDGILAASVEVFVRKGVAATRVEDLLQAANVARRTFYKYFSSKEAVLAGLYELTTGEILRAIRAAGEHDPLEGVRVGIDTYFDYHAGSAPLLKLMVEQAIRSDSPLAPLRKRFRAELASILQRAVVMIHGSASTRFDPLVPMALLSALEGVSLQVLEDGARPEDIARGKAVTHKLVARMLEQL
jgi:AcrR family transcriptional regulator